MTGLAIVTGASSGIGAATAVRLGSEGWTVVLAARRETALEAVAGRVRAAGGAAVVEAADASDGAAAQAIVERTVAAHGVPDAVIHCAGAGAWRFLEETTPAELETMMAAPYHAAAAVDRAVLPHLLGVRRGVLIHVNSPACGAPWPGATGYTAARWALRGLHEALRADLAGTGVETCHVVFGEVSSPYFDVNDGAREALPGIARLIPVLTPERCADVLTGLVQRPRTQVVRPFMLWLFWVTAKVAPGLVRWLLVRTGRRH
jgi:NADP-dependent 3-hydroxy acid dehydrogenase YdfG